MQWSDHFILLALRPLGEHKVILRGLTCNHGLRTGIVRAEAIPGLHVGRVGWCHWSGRLEEHIGTWRVEAPDAPPALSWGHEALSYFHFLTLGFLHIWPEHWPCPSAYALLAQGLEALHHAPSRLAFVTYAEGELLSNLGYGAIAPLDLTQPIASRDLFHHLAERGAVLKTHWPDAPRFHAARHHHLVRLERSTLPRATRKLFPKF